MEPVLLFYMLAVSAEYTFVQELISVKLCANKLNLNDTLSINKLCENKNESSFKAYEDNYLNFIQWYNSLFYFFPLLTTTVMGSWSDLFGRRFTLMLPVLFSFVVQLILLYASTQILNQNILIWILVCSALSGISGSSNTIISTTHSYLTNHVERTSLTKRLTILEACIFLGGFLGYNVTSQILKYSHTSTKFIIGFALCAFMHLAILLYIKFCLSDKDEREIKFNKLIKIRHFFDAFKILTKSRPKFGRPKLYILYYCALSSSFALSVQQMLLFTHLKSFSWTTEKYSKLQGAISLANGLSLVLFFPIIQWALKKAFNFENTQTSRSNILDGASSHQQPLNNEIEQNERTFAESPIEQSVEDQNTLKDSLAEKVDSKIDTIIVTLGFLSKFLGLGLLGLIRDDKYFYVIPPLLMFNEFAMPGIRSMISKTVGSQEKGKAFGKYSKLLLFFKVN